MWNKLSQVAGLAAAEEDNEAKEEASSGSEDKAQLQQQEILIQQLKELVRENEKRFQEKSNEYVELSSKFQKFKLKSKASISHLSSQVKEKGKAVKKEESDFDDASSTDSSDQSQRGKNILLKKQLEQVKQKLTKREEESKKLGEEFERKVNDLELQLNEKNILISTLADAEIEKTKAPVDSSPKKETSSQEMYAQIVYKDTKILDLNNQILEMEKQIMDLQEHIKEKDEVLLQRNRAVQLMAADMSRKGKTVVDELDETREQMKLMQETFSTNESDWKVQMEKYSSRIADLEKEIVDWDKKLKSSETTSKSIEAARYELSVKNTELQKKIVIVQESAAKQCEQYNKEIGGEVEVLKKSLESEKQRANELQKSLDESSNQSDNKVLKARVKERTKFKALERELNELKKAQQDKPQEILELQQKIAELEEEKGSLQLKLIDIEDQVAQSDKLKKQNEELGENVANGLNKIHALEQQTSQLQIERENWETKFETLEESYNELKEQFSKSLKDKSDLEEKHTTLMQCNEHTENELKISKEEYSDLQNSYETICLDLEEIKDRKVSFELKSIELEEIRESDEKTKRELMTKIEELNEMIRMDAKPEIQLEKENIDLKVKLQELAGKNSALETKCQNLSMEIGTLQTNLTNEQTKNSAEIQTLISKMNTIDDSYKEVFQELNLKTAECDNKNALIQELENKMSSLQGELSQLFSHVNVKDINDCINCILQKNKEYSDLKSDFEKLQEEKSNLLQNVQESSDEVKKCSSKIEKLESLFENRDNERRSMESVIDDLKKTIMKKDNVIEKHVCDLTLQKSEIVRLEEDLAWKEYDNSKICSELEEKKSVEKMLFETVNEKLELITKIEGYQENLKKELKTLEESRLADQEKYKSNSESLLGQITDLESELASLTDEINSKERIIEDLNSKMAQLQTDYDNLMNKLEEEINNSQKKDNIIENMENSIKSKNDSLSLLNSELENLKQAVEDKGSEIASLMQRLKEVDLILEVKDQDLSKMNSNMQELAQLLNEKERDIKQIKDKVVLLEEEKLHSTLSLTEKDEVHQQLLTAKLRLEEQISEVQNENRSLFDTLSGKTQELDLLERTVNEMSDLIQNPEESIVKDFVKKLQIGSNKLSTLAEQLFCELKDRQITSTELQNKIGEMEKKKLLLQDTTCNLESQNHKLQENIINIKEENAGLNSKIDASKQEYSVKISDMDNEMQKLQTELKKTFANYELLQSDNSKLAEMHELLKSSLSDYEGKDRDKSDTVLSLTENNASLENKLLEFKNDIENYKKQFQSLQDEFSQNTDIFAKEKVELEFSLQKLQIEKEHFENENELKASFTSALQDMVAEKELQISGLNLHLSVLEEKLSDLNNVLTQKEIQQQQYEDSIKLKHDILVNYKESFSSIVKTLKDSNLISGDISFFETDCGQVESVQELARLTAALTSEIAASLFEIQNITSKNISIDRDLYKSNEEKANLVLENDILRNYLIGLTKTFQENVKDYDDKLQTISSALNHKLNTLDKAKSNVLSLSESFYQQKDNAKESLCRLEEVIRGLTAERVDLDSTIDLLHTTNTDLVTKIEEAMDSNGRLNTTVEQQQKNLENYILENEDLRRIVNNKDHEISRLIREQDHSQGTVVSLQTELTNAQSSISSLQTEVRQLNRQLSEYTDSHVLETTDNVSNGLQVEVERLKQELASSLEEKHSLQQHIDNTNLQMQLLLDEKSALESSIEEMQHKLNELIETNLNLSNALEESNMLMTSNEKRIHDLEVQHSKSVSMFESTCKDVESFKQEKLDFQSKEKDLLNRINLLKKRFESVKCIVNKINDVVSVSDNLNSDFDHSDILADNKDEQYLLRSFKSFTVVLTETRKDKINLQNCIEALELENKKLSETLDETQEKLDNHQNKSITNDDTQQITIVHHPEVSTVLDKSLLQQSSSSPDEAVTTLESDNQALKKEINEYKTKFAKSLSKLKSFKDKNERLGAELKDLKEKSVKLESACSKSTDSEEELQSLLTSLKKEKEELLVQLQLCSEEKQIDIIKSRDVILQLKERSSWLEEENSRIKKELQEYLQSWEQLNVSYELQKEDNEQLRLKLKTLLDQAEVAKAKMSELNLELTQFQNDNLRLKQETENAKEHANMLLSDNDTFQNLIEKLTNSKISLEQKLLELKRKLGAELKASEKKHEQELRDIGALSTQTIDVVSYTKLEEECSSLRQFCSEMEHSIQILRQERDSCLRSQGLLEKEKLYLQHQLCGKVEELQTTKAKLTKTEATASAENNQAIPDSTISVTAGATHQILHDDALKEENASLKSEIFSLTEALNRANENFNLFQQDYSAEEKHNQNLIVELKAKSETSSNEPGIQSSPNMEYELQQAMTSLHKQGLRCEELSLEVSKLLEERNVLRWKLQQCGQLPENKMESEVHAVDAAFSDLVSVKVESPTSHLEVATLHARLAESEKTCQQLRQANDALDRALSNERDQKRIFEEELGYAKEHLAVDAKASDEYQILLGDIAEPEYFPESNFSISRNVQTHAHKMRRWLRGRKNYLWRAVKSRNYRQLVYIFYLFFIHVWLLACVSS